MLDDYEFIWRYRTELYMRHIVTDAQCETELEHVVPCAKCWTTTPAGSANLPELPKLQLILRLVYPRVLTVLLDEGSSPLPHLLDSRLCHLLSQHSND